jgi:hypothetical protein
VPKSYFLLIEKGKKNKKLKGSGLFKNNTIAYRTFRTSFKNFLIRNDFSLPKELVLNVNPN